MQLLTITFIPSLKKLFYARLFWLKIIKNQTKLYTVTYYIVYLHFVLV